MVVSITAFRDIATGETLLNSVAGIDAKSAVPATLYTVPSGKVVVITKVVWRVEAIDTLTVNPEVGIGIAAGEDDIFAPQTMSGFTAVGDTWTFDSVAKAVDASAAEVIQFGFDTFATATTLTLACDVFGYFVGTSLAPTETLPGQVTGGERTAGTETNLRSFAPADVASMAGTHGGGGSLTLIEKKEITVAATDVTFSGLDGNTDGIYVLECYIVPALNVLSIFKLRVNGGALSGGEFVSLAAAYAHAVEAEPRVGYTVITAHRLFSTTKFWARAAGPGGTGLVRLSKCEFAIGPQYFTASGSWIDTSTNVTSLGIQSHVASAIGIGSTFILYKLAGA